MKLLEQGNFDSVVVLLGNEQHHSDSSSYCLGLAHSNLGNTEKAIIYLKLTAELNGESGSPYSNLGMEYGKNGQNELAVESFNKAIELDPLDKGGMRKRAMHNKAIHQYK